MLAKLIEFLRTSFRAIRNYKLSVSGAVKMYQKWRFKNAGINYSVKRLGPKAFFRFRPQDRSVFQGSIWSFIR